ncbi:MAG TPA: ScyD/ScyE family protein [Candidatus Cybelea sp.]|nr:ScyD/ScyE family protein [Candidatus Cybelea sp.]
MRRPVTLPVLATAALACGFLTQPSAIADPKPAAGYRLESIAIGLAAPSGVEAEGEALLLTDLKSGRIVRRLVDGTVVDLAPPLSTGIDVMGQPTGPYKVRLQNGRVFVTQGWPDANRAEQKTDHALLELAAEPGEKPSIVSNAFWNPFDFTWDGKAWLVIDSGHNALMRLGKDGKPVSLFDFPRLKHDPSDLSQLSPTEFKTGGEAYEVDAVPTGLALKDGRAYVALFGGFPFIAKGGAVVSLALDGSEKMARREVIGLDAPVEAKFAADGRLLVLEMGAFDMNAQNFKAGDGRLTAIDLKTGDRKTLISGLDRPSALAVTPDGSVVVTALSGGIYRLSKSP